ncbi:MAG: hypothetical protein NT031_17085, partial [Planctomycetota bacterium]|nr:hypothetical protein [Planctomycetota bacterium]
MTELTTNAAENADDEVEARMTRARLLAEHIEARLAAAEVVVPTEGILAGPVRWAPMAGGPGWAQDNLHYPMDVGTLLGLGCVGIAAKARANAADQS